MIGADLLDHQIVTQTFRLRESWCFRMASLNSPPSRRTLLRAATLLPAAAVLPLAGRATKAASADSRKSAKDHYEYAARLAGDDPVLLALVKALRPDATFPPGQAPLPYKIFDNIAVVSTGSVAATALLTSQGVILIDALGSSEDAEKIIIPQLRAMGVDPATIKYIAVTHGHADHFGGARYLADQYGTRVMMSPADWNLISAVPPADAPTRDLEISDGQRLTLGDTTVSFHHTPGHTPGTVSMIFPVRWRQQQHTAMLWGGTNPPSATADKQHYLASALAFASRMRRAGVDVELNNHQGADYGLARMEQLRIGATGQKNPFVIGLPRTQRFMRVMEAMIRGRIATDQESGSTTGTAVAASPHAHCCSI